MNTQKLLAVLSAAENRKAVTIGMAAGAAVVVGACAIKVAGLGLAGKLVVGAALAGATGYIAKQRLDNGMMDAMVASLENELKTK